ncbi:ATP-binding protein [Marinomonas piezotolerans]|nr:ATP-binding protein [Marinomonas piezotolerans]
MHGTTLAIVCSFLLWVAPIALAEELETRFELTQDEQNWINQHPTITFSGDPNWLPFEAFTESGEYIGIVASFLQHFTEDTGITISFHPTRTWAETLELASSQQVDVISDVLGSAVLFGTHTFSDSYLTNNLVLISNAVGTPINDIPALGDVEIGLIKAYGYTWELYERYPNTKFVEVENIQEGLAALESHRFDYLVTTYALGQFQLAALDKTGLHLRGELPVETHLAFAVRNDWPELTALYNRWINSLSPEQRYQIAENWYLDNTDFFSKEKTNWTYVAWLAFIIAILLALIAYGLTNRAALRQHKRRFETALAAIHAVEWKMPKHSAHLELARGFVNIVPGQPKHPTNLNELLQIIDPRDQGAVHDAFREAHNNPDTQLSVAFRLNSLNTCWLRLKGSTIGSTRRPYLAGTIENVTHSKQIEIEKNRTDKLITLLYDSVPDLMWLELFEPKELIANKAYLRFFSDKTPLDTLPPDQKKVWQEQLQTLLKHKHTSHFSGWLTPTDATKAYFSVLRIPFLDEHNHVIGIFSVARDITDNFLLQQELQSAKHIADQANASKTVFLANMSHEIRTPLNAILGYAQILTQNERLDPEAARQVQRVHSAGRRLLSLINDILDLSKIEAGKLQFNPENIALRHELDELLALHRQRAEAKGLLFKEDIRLSAQDYASIDRTKFGQIVLNAVDNAIKFTNTGSVTVKAEYVQQHLCMTVSDTGPGINQDELEHLFQPFSQGQSGTQHGGTGLGLVLARRLADAMNGSFSLSSVVGEGTQVHIKLPIELHSEQQGPVSLQAQTWRLKHTVTALIIEDDELSRSLMQHMLEQMGFQTIIAEDGEQALTYIDRPIDIVFSDIRMPNMDGLTLINHIRSQKHLTKTPVIAVTASSFEHEKHFYLKNGFTDFVPKPVELEQLYRAIKKILPMQQVTTAKPDSETPQIDPPDTTTSAPSHIVDEGEIHALVNRFQHACQLGNADDALFFLEKLQHTSLPADKLTMLKASIEQYDFDAALTINLY